MILADPDFAADPLAALLLFFANLAVSIFLSLLLIIGRRIRSRERFHYLLAPPIFTKPIAISG
jgi:hypothetical protein